MPIKRCESDGKPGYKWGDAGKCYTGKDAKAKAIAQGVAIGGGELRERRMMKLRKALGLRV